MHRVSYPSMIRIRWARYFTGFQVHVPPLFDSESRARNKCVIFWNYLSPRD
jgi:hypothetical protein